MSANSYSIDSNFSSCLQIYIFQDEEPPKGASTPLPNLPPGISISGGSGSSSNAGGSPSPAKVGLLPIFRG